MLGFVNPRYLNNLNGDLVTYLEIDILPVDVLAGWSDQAANVHAEFAFWHRLSIAKGAGLSHDGREDDRNYVRARNAGSHGRLAVERHSERQNLRRSSHRPPNVPPLSSGRTRKRGGSRWRRASPW